MQVLHHFFLRGTNFACFLLMKKLFSLLFSIVLTASLQAAVPHYVDLDAPAPEIDSLVQALLASSAEYIGLPCSYQSVDERGLPVTLSGKIYLPRTRQSKRVVLQTHYTILSNAEAPSQCDALEAVLRDRNYVSVLPDYQGYGISVERRHPYLSCDLTARQCVDMLLATNRFLERLQRQPVSDSVALVGYSQGGQTIIAVQRLLETSYPAIPILKCYTGAGPYDVARTYDVSVATNYAGLQFTVPMLIMGTSWGQNLNLDSTYFLRPKTLRRAEKYLFTKQYDAVYVTLLGRMGLSHKLSDLMPRKARDKSQPETRRFYDALVRNSIVHVDETDTILGDWTPRAPIFLLHSMDDKAVVFENSESLRLMLDAKGANVTYDFGHFGDHITALGRFYDVVKRELP